MAVREHMTFERCSVGPAIVNAILACWRENRVLPWTSDRNQRIDDNILRVMTEHDLTLDEWHYWCKQSSSIGETWT